MMILCSVSVCVCPLVRLQVHSVHSSLSDAVHRPASCLSEPWTRSPQDCEL